jgi:hypothetical protein
VTAKAFILFRVGSETYWTLVVEPDALVVVPSAADAAPSLVDADEVTTGPLQPKNVRVSKTAATLPIVVMMMNLCDAEEKSHGEEVRTL